MAPTILIVTHRSAQEVDGVIDRLRKDGADITRWNLCEYPERLFSSVDVNSIAVGDEHGCEKVKPSAAWFHEHGSFSVAETLNGLARELSLRECEAFWAGTLAVIDCPWLNHPSKIRDASNKIFQLRLAERLGIPVPEYLITNSAAKSLEFIERNKTAIAKAVRGGYLVHPEKNIKLLTRRIVSSDEFIFESLQYGPLIFQKEIERSYECRVTVVGNRCYSMEIDCRELPGEIVDVRELEFLESHERFRRARKFPHLEKWSRLIVRELGLSYAGLDWAVGVNGEPYFLECNPLGAFKWSEMITGEDISKAISDELLALGRSNSNVQ